MPTDKSIFRKVLTILSRFFYRSPERPSVLLIGRFQVLDRSRIFGVTFVRICALGRGAGLTLRKLCGPTWVPAMGFFLGILSLAYLYCIDLAYLRRYLTYDGYFAAFRFAFHLDFPGNWLPKIFFYELAFRDAHISISRFRLDLCLYIASNILGWWLIVWFFRYGIAEFMRRLLTATVRSSIYSDIKNMDFNMRFPCLYRISLLFRNIFSIIAGTFKPIWAIFAALFMGILPLAYVMCAEMSYRAEALLPQAYESALRFMSILDFPGRWLPKIFVAHEPLFWIPGISAEEFWQGLATYILANFLGWLLIIRLLDIVVRESMLRVIVRAYGRFKVLRRREES